jgi:hypothetical protein
MTPPSEDVFRIVLHREHGVSIDRLALFFDYLLYFIASKANISKGAKASPKTPVSMPPQPPMTTLSPYNTSSMVERRFNPQLVVTFDQSSVAILCLTKLLG